LKSNYVVGASVAVVEGVRRLGDGNTDITAAARLLRFEEISGDLPSLCWELIEDRRPSCSEMTLQSSLGAPPGADPLELYPDCGWSRMVECSPSISSSSSSSESGTTRFIKERA